MRSRFEEISQSFDCSVRTSAKSTSGPLRAKEETLEESPFWLLITIVVDWRFVIGLMLLLALLLLR